MKKYLPIFLAFQILATSSPSNQGMQTLLKMGAFFHHFIHHIACHQEKIGIVDFVQLHYSDHEHHESDHAEHDNLPFHHHHQGNCCQIQLHTLFLLHPTHFALHPRLEILSSKSLISYDQNWRSSPHLGDIWQPPKA